MVARNERAESGPIVGHLVEPGVLHQTQARKACVRRAVGECGRSIAPPLVLISAWVVIPDLNVVGVMLHICRLVEEPVSEPLTNGVHHDHTDKKLHQAVGLQAFVQPFRHQQEDSGRNAERDRQREAHAARRSAEVALLQVRQANQSSCGVLLLLPWYRWAEGWRFGRRHHQRGKSYTRGEGCKTKDGTRRVY